MSGSVIDFPTPTRPPGSRRSSGSRPRPEMVAAREDQPPFLVDAIVVESDRWRVLGAPIEPRPTSEHPIRLMQALYEAEPAEPGTVIACGGRPLRLEAIVHDLDRDPTWYLAWIETALAEVFRIAGVRGLRSLGLPLLGTRYGRLAPADARSLLLAAARRYAPRGLERVWLIDFFPRARPAPSPV